jgi:hypothetical protein
MNFRATPLAAILLSLPVTAHAVGPSTVSEALSTKQAVPPSIIFVIDRDSDMANPCYSGSTTSCFEDALDIVKQVSRHYGEVKYGVVATADSAGDSTFHKVAPVGSTYAQISAALSALTVSSGTTSNLAEVVDSVSEDYLELTDPEDGVDDDGDGYDGDWDETPFAYYCSEVYVIVLTSGRPVDDDDPDSGAGSAGTPTDVYCDAAGYAASAGVPDTQCRYDNVVTDVYGHDHSSLAGYQRLVVSTVAMGLDPAGNTDDEIADALYQSAADNTYGDGVYSNSSSKDDALAAVLGAVSDLMSGTYARSNPVIANNGSYLLYTYYELTGDRPLAEGHVLAFEMDTDPGSSTYGEILYYSGAPYDDYLGAVWDGGWLLYSRVADAGELNNDDMDGFQQRDIYFYEDTFAKYMPGDAAEKRLSFDAEMAGLTTTSTLLDLVLDASTGGSGALNSPEHDLDQDGTVDSDDVQALVDFTRGVSSARFRYIDLERGRWKLQDSPYSAPTVVTARNDRYSMSTSYRTFLDLLEAEEMPDLVLLAANDGMLHAFALTDDESTPTADESGEELWAWVPNTLILRDRGNAWGNGLVDAVMYGRSYLFDGAPVVEDVWIDANGDRKKDCGASLDDCEWRRVVVVQQSFGGSRTLALDITNTDAPEFLWEQTNSVDATAMGYTTSRPAIFNIYDYTDSAAPTDRWVALWGSGRAAEYSDSKTNYYDTVEGSLYMWAIGDSAFSTSTASFSDQGSNIGTAHPDYTGAGASLDVDSDGRLEYTYISAPPTVVDADSDGDADVVYFPVTLGYDPSSGLINTVNPGQSFIYKALINDADPGNLTWCEFYDPLDGAVPDGDSAASAVAYGSRPEVYYAITTSWMRDGSLGVYWGTGSPFQDNDDLTAGAFFFMKDSSPETCAAPMALECGTETGGFYQLAAGERLTSDPLVYGGVVYFSTYTPDTDLCTVGEGRIYGLDYTDCGSGIDTTGDGAATSADNAYISTTGFVSNIAIGENGKLYYATGTTIDAFDAVQDPFAGTATVGWMEMY